MDPEAHVDALGAQGLGDLGQRVLTICNGQPVPGHNDHLITRAAITSNQAHSGAIGRNQEPSDAMSTYFLEAEGGEGLEAAVLKTIFRFPPHTHDLVVHVHLQSGAISSNQ